MGDSFNHGRNNTIIKLTKEALNAIDKEIDIIIKFEKGF
jgi:hypothetical protein